MMKDYFILRPFWIVFEVEISNYLYLPSCDCMHPVIWDDFTVRMLFGMITLLGLGGGGGGNGFENRLVVQLLCLSESCVLKSMSPDLAWIFLQDNTVNPDEIRSRIASTSNWWNLSPVGSLTVT